MKEEMTNRSLVDIGQLSKPATALVEKVSEAVGGIFKPYQIKRIASAKAAAKLIRAQADIEVTDLQRRALTRFVTEEAQKQCNIEAITGRAIPRLEDSSQPEKMDNDWISKFFHECRIVSDDEMQNLWSRILAGEANTPGSFSKRTVNILSSIDKADARLFTILCGFCWDFGRLIPLIYDIHATIYNGIGIDFASLTHLDDIGLITFNSLTGMKCKGFPRTVLVHYYGRPIVVEFEHDRDNELDSGKVIFTRVGEQLAQVCDSGPVEGFFDDIIDTWWKKGLILSSPWPRQGMNASS